SFVRNAIITNCWLEGADIGIELLNCADIIVEQNIIVSGNEGIRSHSGFNISYFRNTIVDNNYGIDTNNERNSTFIENIVYANAREGLSLSYAANNTIAQNELGWNRGELTLTGETNAIDDGVYSNNWTENSYSDYSGTGAYEIEGDTNSTDYQALLLEDNVAPLLQSGETISVPRGNPSFSLSVIEDYPLLYDITIDGERLDSGYYFECVLNVALAGSSVGIHIITISLQDGARNEASFDIEVEITEEADILPTIYAIIGIAVVGSIIIAMEVYHRRK
ncbi:MAG: right-handed parallel beta-helix repeat-containing protein, partial [Candidatus Thorarchaeota archaeon]